MEIIKKKYSGPRINSVEPTELKKFAKAILFRIHTITGWKIPDDPIYLNTIVSEFQQYLTEQCSDLTTEEFVYAVRTFGLNVESWGNSINISLVNKPIQIYREKRAAVSDRERELLERSEMPQKTIEASKTVDWSEVWENLKIRAKNGELNNPFVIIPAALFDWIQNEGISTFTEEDKKTALKNARLQWISEIVESAKINPLTPEDKTLLQQLRDGAYVKNNPQLLASLIVKAKISLVKEVIYSEIVEEE